MSNVSWGEERIANELLLKLGIHISPRTVRKYMPAGGLGGPRGDQRWSTFVRMTGLFLAWVCARSRRRTDPRSQIRSANG